MQPQKCRSHTHKQSPVCYDSALGRGLLDAETLPRQVEAKVSQQLLHVTACVTAVRAEDQTDRKCNLFSGHARVRADLLWGQRSKSRCCADLPLTGLLVDLAHQLPTSLTRSARYNAADRACSAQ